MDTSKAMVLAASSPSETPALPPTESDSQFSNLICDVSQQVQAAMANMLKMTQEIDHSSSGILEEIEYCKVSAMEKRKVLEEEKESFQKAAYTVLEMLNNR
ncbi:uncharacterized protein LOC122652368 [Telopea speciosissima]|uniref:uncharacterized protein LOC122652368 n=1 Tax=Telopea speciosissima TaxID=54955 RepID=UPI001CC68E0B|nr:uncharacterized protein LOC122652368 [Telopea speciosissima]XP_043702016.1 uncharacterized protein LOC122652368 [Telopea speciosissima]